ncbi:MAG TPA: lysophospholipid acyltransferase family protein [Candidatus Dormibacteraeota bacterium]|nr:lysophospholipid acyltransferase family protein [Candidatus Dormibacteraeota bacterium]
MAVDPGDRENPDFVPAHSVPSGGSVLPGTRLDGGQSGLLVLTRAVLRVTVRVLAEGGVDLEGLGNVPVQGPLLICSNHLSNFDPLVYAALLPRVLHALTKAELYANPVMRQFLLHCNCIPVHRGAPDRVAIRAALAVLRSQGALLLFPEGHRAPAGTMLGFEPGAGYLALRSRATVLPCAVWGTERILPKGRLWPRRGSIAVRLGAPFQPRGADPGLVSRQIRERVGALLPEQFRRSADAD